VALTRRPASRRPPAALPRSSVCLSTPVTVPASIHSPGRGSSSLQFCEGRLSAGGQGSIVLASHRERAA